MTESPFKGKSGLRRLCNATRYSLDGIRAALVHEHGFRQLCLLAAVLVPAGLWLGATGVDKAMLVASVLMVLVVELLNSSIEAAVDRISLEEHRFAKRAKDMGSAAVMVALAACGCVWLLVLFS